MFYTPRWTLKCYIYLVFCVCSMVEWSLQNCQLGMDLAQQNFSIPMILKPENLSSPDLDELSCMTYLSYFMKVDSPGYSATLRWVQQQIPNENVQNFQVRMRQCEENK